MNRAPFTGQTLSGAVDAELRTASRSFPPVYTLYGDGIPLAAINVASGTPVRPEIRDSVSPGCTRTVSAVLTGPATSGMVSTCR